MNCSDKSSMLSSSLSPHSFEWAIVYSKLLSNEKILCQFCLMFLMVGLARLAQPVAIRWSDREEMGREWGNSSIYVANIFWIKTDHGEALQLVWAGRSLVAQANVKNFFLYDGIICDFKQCSRKVLSKILMWNYFQIFFVEGFLLMSPICENKRGLQSNFLFLQRPQIEQLKH